MWRHDIGSPLDRLQIEDAQAEFHIMQSPLELLGSDQVASNTRTLCQEVKHASRDQTERKQQSSLT